MNFSASWTVPMTALGREWLDALLPAPPEWIRARATIGGEVWRVRMYTADRSLAPDFDVPNENEQ